MYGLLIIDVVCLCFIMRACATFGAISVDSFVLADSKKNFTSKMASNEYWLLIIDGYIRKENEVLKLNIPQDINKLIVIFFLDEIRYFDKYNKELFKLENDDKKIIPIGPKSNKLKSFMVTPFPNGFKKGIHKWAIRFVEDIQLGEYTRRCIGVVTMIDDKWINKDIGGAWPRDINARSYKQMGSNWNGYGFGTWKENEIIEVILNLDSFIIQYYKIINDKPSKIIKLAEDELSKDETYYFAFCIDCDERCCVFESVLPQIRLESH